MSLEKENQAVPTPPSEKKSKKLCYTREFLLSFSELDVCKKLPSGVDASILSQFEDASGSVYERRPLLQNRPESSGGYGRGGQGRWETRSSGSSDKDGDMQPDREPLGQDTGKHFGNQTRRFLPNSEHDGLLGSGAFPRPSGYPAPNARGNGPYQLKKSTEPYQPPRPYKAAPYSRFTDSYNDETFGSAECSSEDRAKEERKRRASFELMRKEQQKTLQEKHKANPENRKANLDVDIFSSLGNSAAGKSIRIGDKSDETLAASLSRNDSSKSSLHMPTPAARPLIPPGFASASVEKNLSVLSSSTSHTLEAGSGLVENDHSLNIVEKDKDKKSNSVAYTQFNMESNEAKSISDLFVNAYEKPVAPTSSAKVLEQALDSENVAGMGISIQEASEVWVDDIDNDFKHKNETLSEVMNTASQDHSTTILEKLFSSALSKNFHNSPNANEHQGVKVDEETWSPELSESSKFAHWFPTEEKKPIDDFSSRDLLSIINEKVNTHVSASPSERAMEPIPTGLPLEKIESVHKLHSFTPISSVVQKSEQYLKVDKKSPSSAVLTCEDLEQSILAEATDSSPSLQQPTIQVAWTPFDGNLTAQKVNVDDHASQHLLSLLQKGTSLKESISSPGPDLIEPSDKIAACEVTSSLNLHISDNAVVRDPEMVHSSEKSITLETFFGSSFMNDLHSAEAPVSAKRDPVATVNNTDSVQQHGLEFPHADGSFFSSVSPESRFNKIINEGEMLALNNTQKNPNMSVPWVGGFSDSSIEGPKLHGMGIEEGGDVDVQLPEEDSLFTVGDTLKPVASDPFPFENAHNTEFLHRNNVDDLNSRLFGAILGDGERLRTRVPEGLSPLNDGPGPFVDPDSLYNHLHGRPSAQYPHQMNHTRPLFPPLDHLTQRNALMKFVGPGGLHHDPHHFPGNVIPQHAFSNVGAQRFDPAVAHHPMLQHMSVPGNFPPHHPMQVLPGGILPSQAINHMPSYIPDMNNIHNFSVHHRQPNYGGLGIGLPESVAQGSGDHQPEALTRLIEMEIRANSKHNHPAVGGHIPRVPGIHNPELDMNFRYR